MWDKRRMDRILFHVCIFRGLDFGGWSMTCIWGCTASLPVLVLNTPYWCCCVVFCDTWLQCLVNYFVVIFFFFAIHFRHSKGIPNFPQNQSPRVLSKFFRPVTTISSHFYSLFLVLDHFLTDDVSLALVERKPKRLLQDWENRNGHKSW